VITTFLESLTPIGVFNLQLLWRYNYNINKIIHYHMFLHSRRFCRRSQYIRYKARFQEYTWNVYQYNSESLPLQRRMTLNKQKYPQWFSCLSMPFDGWRASKSASSLFSPLPLSWAPFLSPFPLPSAFLFFFPPFLTSFRGLQVQTWLTWVQKEYEIFCNNLSVERRISSIAEQPSLVKILLPLPTSTFLACEVRFRT